MDLKRIHINCLSGVSGDMITGALLDLGTDIGFLSSELSKLNISGYSINAGRIDKGGIQATRFYVETLRRETPRHLSDIYSIIEKSRLEDPVKELSKRIFCRLGRAEAEAHDTSIEEVHFHEVGATDAIIDIVSAAILLDHRGTKEIYCTTIPYGTGKIETLHGTFDIPAPAVKNLLRDAPTRRTGIPDELTTPTGAAIIETITKRYSDDLRECQRKGYGAGARDLARPNVLEIRVIE